MCHKSVLLYLICSSAFVLAAPAPQVSGYTGADAPYAFAEPTGLGRLATSFGLNSQVPAIETHVPTGDEPGAAPQRLIADLRLQYHGPYEGTPFTTGAVKAETTLAASIAPLPPNPTHTYYNPDGTLLDPAPAPYVPAGKKCLEFIPLAVND
jgi:hypothetical protein